MGRWKRPPECRARNIHHPARSNLNPTTPRAFRQNPLFILHNSSFPLTPTPSGSSGE